MSATEPSISFDRQTDAVAIVFSEEPVARTVEIGDGRLLDLNAAGHVIAVEVLGASAGFWLADLAEEYGFVGELEGVEMKLFRMALEHAAELA